MIIGTATINGIKAVLIPTEEYNQLRKAAGVDEDILPPYPPADANGNMPALEAVQVSFARSIIKERRKLGLSQADLAKRAGVRQATVCRIESGKYGLRGSTIDKILDVLDPQPSKKKK